MASRETARDRLEAELARARAALEQFDAQHEGNRKLLVGHIEGVCAALKAMGTPAKRPKKAISTREPIPGA